MFLATYTSGDLGPISIDLIGEFLNQLSENASTLASLLVVIIVIGLVFSLLKSIFGIGMLIKPEVNEEETEEETVEELPERNEYQATLECNNCKHEQKIPIVKGYDIEEAIKLGDYFCKICGSKKLKRKRPYWE